MRKKKKRRKVVNAGLALTSLMDVLTIILLFLLVNYSESQVELDLPKSMKLPLVSAAPSEKLDDGFDIRIENNIISIGDDKFYANQGVREEVVEKVTQSLQKAKTSPDSTRVMIKADQSVNYDVIDKVIEGAATAGFAKIDFVALAGDEK